ncbi:MAG: EndoU domain-containing protein [Gammaproteobacteria bacterium]|nr:EndoU domain-containing protein [Gammaproteobacteria bacterium]
MQNLSHYINIRYYFLCFALLAIGVTAPPASAAINCSAGAPGVAARLVDPGEDYDPDDNPYINQRHIFCGDINAGGNAVGFHSRPNGDNPTAAIDGGDPQTAAQLNGPVATIIATNNQLRLYRYTGGTVQILNLATGGFVNKTSNGGASTFYPNRCTQAQVITSIVYAYNHKAHNGGADYTGLSGPAPADVHHCYTANNAAFTIQMYIHNVHGNMTINTAYPI